MSNGQETLPDADTLKIRYMASPHIVWDKFCEAEGMSPRNRAHYPVALWQDEKKAIIQKREAEELSAILFDRRFSWNKEVLKTLDTYPKFADGILFQLNRKLEHVRKLSDEEFNYGSPAVKDKEGKVIREKRRGVSMMDMHMMALAYKAVTESKMKALMLDTWSVKNAEDDAKPEEKDVTESKGFMMKVIGKGEMSITDLESMMAEYLDKPATKDPNGDT